MLFKPQRRSKTSQISLDTGAVITLEEAGKGRPVIFLHGVLMSRKFFKKQLSPFAKKHHAITYDLPGHGCSTDINSHHTLVEYAKTLHTIIQKKDLKDVVLVGWSMGAFLAWQYLADYGDDLIAGVVVVDETLTDLKRDDYEHAPLDLPSLQHFIELAQLDYKAVADSFMELMFKDKLSEKDKQFLHSEIMKVTPTTASSILFDQTVRDYREIARNNRHIPHLLCFGRDEKLVTVAAAQHMHKHIQGSKLVIFDESSHCPFWEEPQKFNAEVMAFIKDLDVS